MTGQSESYSTKPSLRSPSATDLAKNASLIIALFLCSSQLPIADGTSNSDHRVPDELVSLSRRYEECGLRFSCSERQRIAEYQRGVARSERTSEALYLLVRDAGPGVGRFEAVRQRTDGRPWPTFGRPPWSGPEPYAWSQAFAEAARRRLPLAVLARGDGSKEVQWATNTPPGDERRVDSWSGPPSWTPSGGCSA